ncbi:MAG: RhuM family protein [Pseudomonadota bacterium]
MNLDSQIVETRQTALFISDDGQVQLDLKVDQETLWLTQAQMAQLFEVKPQNITMHLKNIYKEQELTESATCKDFLQVQREGKRDVKRQHKYYTLDAVISVGYRVNSTRATQFRIWATRTLKQHLIEGYTLKNQSLIDDEGAAVLGVIDGNTLVALALLVAESQADQKELMIRLIEHFIGLKTG